MESNKKIKIIICALTTGVMTSFCGALASSLAWYSYSTRAGLSFEGTSVFQTEQLQIGIQTDFIFGVELEERYGISYETLNEKSYMFASPGIGLNSEILNAYLNHVGYASNELYPVTSRKYSVGSSLSLKHHPLFNYEEVVTDAEMFEYSKIPFAFRVLSFDGDGTITYEKNQPIWLSNCLAEASGEGEVYKSIRVFFEHDDTKFILNPSANENGNTKVAGLLDLNADGFYDTRSYDFINDVEIVYGDYEGSLPPTVHTTDISEIADINGTGNDTFLTTFSAKHKANVDAYTSLDGLNMYSAEFKCLDAIKPEQTSTGYLSGGLELTKTSDDSASVADLTAIVYLEGWDHSVIDQEQEHMFNLGLTFEVNRLS